ncbi:hypothetical protein BH10PSE7_BH10PSE7_36210 [soil metagenome]
MKHLIALPLLVILAGCAAHRYEATYPVCQKLAQDEGKVIRWLDKNHRRVVASHWGKTDPEVAGMLARKWKIHLKRREAFCI